MAENSPSISDLIEQPADRSPIKITKTVSNISIIEVKLDGMPPIESVENDDASVIPEEANNTGASAIPETVVNTEQIVVLSQELEGAEVKQVESLLDIIDDTPATEQHNCNNADVVEKGIPEGYIDASIAIVIKAFCDAEKRLSVDVEEPQKYMYDDMYDGSSTHLCAHLSQNILDNSGIIGTDENKNDEASEELQEYELTIEDLKKEDDKVSDVEQTEEAVAKIVDDTTVVDADEHTKENIQESDVITMKLNHTVSNSSVINSSGQCDKSSDAKISWKANSSLIATDISMVSSSGEFNKSDDAKMRANADKRRSRKALNAKTTACGAKVQTNLNESIKILEKDFEHQGPTGINGSRGGTSSYASIQELGNSILEKEINNSKKTCSTSTISKIQRSTSLLTENSSQRDLVNQIAYLEEVYDYSKQEVANYQRELERVRPNGNDILLLCNEVQIDPAIATVQNLLLMLKNVKDEIDETRGVDADLKLKLSEQTKLLSEQESLITELDTKLRSQDFDDDQRVENKCDEIFEYYEDKLAVIQQQLKIHKVELTSDFWVPHAHSLTARLTEIRVHNRTVAEAVLLRDLSNTETDKFDSNEDLHNTFANNLNNGKRRSSVVETSQSAGKGKYKVENDMPKLAKSRNKIKGKESKTCCIQ